MFGKSSAFAEAIKKWVSQPDSTPDAAGLEDKFCQLLFVYDNMMSGLSQHHLLEYDAVCMNRLYNLKWGVQTFRQFSLWKHRDSGLGIALRNAYPGAPLHPIRGELYAVAPSLLFELDNIKRNGVFFDRQEQKIAISYLDNNGNSKIKTHDVFMYVGRREHWEPQLSAYNFEAVQLTRRVPANSHRSMGVYYQF